MTVVAAYTNGKEWAMSSDSASFSSDSDMITISVTPKMWKVGSTLVGGCGSYRILELAKQTGEEDIFKIRDALLKADVSGDWDIVTVGPKGFWYCGDDYGVVKHDSGYGAVGMAGVVAVGALAALAGGEPKMIVKRAAEIAVSHSTGAAGKVRVLTGGSSERNQSSSDQGNGVQHRSNVPRVRRDVGAGEQEQG